MIVHPDLAALRSNDAPQRRIQAELGEALKAWRSRPSVAAIEADFTSYARGASIDGLPHLAALFRQGDPTAAQLACGLIDLFVAELKRERLGQIPMRHQADDLGATLVLFQSGGAVLVLQTVDGPGLSRRKPASTACFTPGETFEHVLKGSARAALVRCLGEVPGGVRLETTGIELYEGHTSRRDGASECLHLREVAGTMVSLKLQRRSLSGTVSREYELADGSFIKQAAATSRESRLELAATLLARMGRRDGAPLLAAMAEEDGGQSLRWQSLKECLALDTATGFAALCRIAARAEDPLAGPAGALRAQLIEAYPQLKEVDPCLA